MACCFVLPQEFDVVIEMEYTAAVLVCLPACVASQLWLSTSRSVSAEQLISEFEFAL